jgi:hypothetical protein
MTFAKKASMVLLAGVTAVALSVPQAEAKNGRNAALAGGLLLGAIAGAAIAGAGPAYGGERVYIYEREPEVVYVKPRKKRIVRVYREPPPVYYYEEEPIYRSHGWRHRDRIFYHD